MKGLIYIIFLIISSFLVACNGNTNHAKRENTYVVGKRTIVDSFYSNGVLKEQRTYIQDSNCGVSDIIYYPNGKIAKWEWSKRSYAKYPFATIYYNLNGSLDSFKGSPFINAIITDKNDVYVRAINPPNLKFQILLDDSSKISKQFLYDPILTDSTSWVFLGEEGKYKKGHRYMVYYFVDDSNKRESIGLTKAMVIDSDCYTFIKVPSRLHKW